VAADRIQARDHLLDVPGLDTAKRVWRHGRAPTTAVARLEFGQRRPVQAVAKRQVEGARQLLGDELSAVRRNGYAICIGELEESLFGASAPVLSEQGRPLAIVSVWGTEHRLPRERLAEVGLRALDAADELKELLR